MAAVPIHRLDDGTVRRGLHEGAKLRQVAADQRLGEELGKVQRPQLLVGVAQAGGGVHGQRCAPAGGLHQLGGVEERQVHRRVLPHPQHVEHPEGHLALGDDAEVMTLLLEDLHLARPGADLASLMEERLLAKAEQPGASLLGGAHQGEGGVVVDQHLLERVHQEAEGEGRGLHLAPTVTEPWGGAATDQPARQRANTLPQPIASRRKNVR
jgi:hypothetical protein